MLRATHIVIPQARETHEIVLDKSYWTWGGEIGVNEHGLAVGNEAIFSRREEKSDGLITGDLLRLMLERAQHLRGGAAGLRRRADGARPGRQLRAARQFTFRFELSRLG